MGPYTVAEKQPGRLWRVRTKRGELLGVVAWYDPWKKFVFQPEDLTAFSGDCLAGIAELLVHLGRKGSRSN